MAQLAPVKLTTLAAAAPIWITDSATVGTNLTMDPDGFKPGGIATWVDRSGGVALGYNRMSLFIRPPTKESRVSKISYKHFRPVLETIDPAVGVYGPVLAYEGQIHTDIIIPERMTLAERTAMFNAYVSSFLATINASDAVPTDATGSPIIAAIKTLEPVY